MMAMNGIVTRHFLRKRFWIATFVLLAAIAGSAGVIILMANAQADRGNYYVAFHHLNNATIRLERELARLSVVPDGEVAERKRARSAFVGLLTDYVVISASSLANSGVQAQGGATPPRVDDTSGEHTAELATEFGVETAAAMAGLRIRAGSMPEPIAEIWERNASAPRSTAPMALGNALFRLLRLAAPLVRGEGPFSAAERRHHQEIGRLAYDRIQPTLTRVEKTLDTEGRRLANRSILFVIALTGAGFAAALFNFIAIFRPLINTVMTRQAEILSERDKATADRQAKQNFLSVVSHELRTPMNGVLGFASLLAASNLKPEHRKQVEIIQSSGKSLLALVNDILDFSKLEAGSLELVDENFSVEEVVSDVVALLRSGAAAKHLEMSVYFDARLPETSRGDANRLRQILTNLVGNAIKFTDRGSIGIEAHEVSDTRVPGSGSELQLAVSDTGIGVPPEKTEAIFERFTQIDSSARRKFEGTGLGLSICKQLVDKMGGRIWVESTPGVGSTFFVRIPLAAAEPPAAESAWRAKAALTLAGRRVLVVDDHSINRRMFRLQLEPYGLRVDDAAGAVEAVRLLETAAVAQEPYAVAILDHMMPDIDGVELARRIRADGRFAEMRLLLSSSAGTRGLAEARELGFDAVEEKPVLPRTLIGAICGLIGDETMPGGETAGAPPGEADGARILLVEDNPVDRRLALEILSCSRYRADTVADGLEAARAAAKLPYDLILMDIQMPVMGGVEATRRIRALGGPAGRTPIIALTANAQDEDVAKYYAAGMQNVIEKPFARDTLFAALDAAIAPREAPVISLASQTAAE